MFLELSNFRDYRRSSINSQLTVMATFSGPGGRSIDSILFNRDLKILDAAPFKNEVPSERAWVVITTLQIYFRLPSSMAASRVP